MLFLEEFMQEQEKWKKGKRKEQLLFAVLLDSG